RVGISTCACAADGAGVGSFGSGGGRIGDEQAGFVSVHVEDVDAVGRRVDHRFVIGRVSVDVEVEAAGVGFVAETPDAVAGVLVHPGLWRFLSAGERSQRGEQRKRRDSGTDKRRHGELSCDAAIRSAAPLRAQLGDKGGTAQGAKDLYTGTDANGK